MKKMQDNPILVTGAERSGSTLVAKILHLCGVESGECNNMFENRSIVGFNMDVLSDHVLEFPETEDLLIPNNWKAAIDGVRTAQGGYLKPWMIKHSTLARLWPVYHHAFPSSKWLIVRRRTGDVIQSCIKTGYMKQFKNPDVLSAYGFENEAAGWLWWIHKYEARFIEMMQAGLNCRIIWPDRMVFGDYQQMYETIEWLGLKWNDQIPSVIDPLLKKSREAMK